MVRSDPQIIYTFLDSYLICQLSQKLIEKGFTLKIYNQCHFMCVISFHLNLYKIKTDVLNQHRYKYFEKSINITRT